MSSYSDPRRARTELRTAGLVLSQAGRTMSGLLLVSVRSLEARFSSMETRPEPAHFLIRFAVGTNGSKESAN